MASLKAKIDFAFETLARSRFRHRFMTLLVMLAATLLLAGNLHAQPREIMNGGKPTWALLMGGLMLGGAAIMATSSHDDDDGHGTVMMPVMMAVVGTGMLIYYFSSDDVRTTDQMARGDRPQLWHRFHLGIQRDAVRATGTWRW